MVQEVISKIFNVDVEDVIILGSDDFGRLSVEVKISDEQSIMVSANEDASVIELDLGEEKINLQDYDYDSQQNLLKSAAVWPCWGPGWASCK